MAQIPLTLKVTVVVTTDKASAELLVILEKIQFRCLS